ncbi:MAG TPA: head GIN domain-containing protein [Flavobacterium sp.]|nr:head GIN domain-containing protein [Flavobacterium sp.]
MDYRIKYVFTLFTLLLLCSSCNSETANQCVRTSGSTVKYELEDIPPFNRIRIEEGIELVLSQEATHKIEIEAGSNLINDISVNVIDGELIIKSNVSCNWLREYASAKVYVTFVELSQIYSVSQYKVRSTQVLFFDHIELASGVYQEGVSSEFEMEIQSNHLTIQSNDASYFKISGTSNSMFVAFWAGVPRIEAPNFKVNTIDVFQRSSNDMILHPIDEIRGNIYSTGNVILKNTPNLIDVQQHYTGELIIND